MRSNAGKLRLPLTKTTNVTTADSAWPYVVYVSFKCLRTLALFVAANLLRHLPVIVFSFLVLMFSGGISLTLQKYWGNGRSRKGKSFSPSQQEWIRIGINGGFYGLVFVLWAKGLQECGALRTMILEYSSLCVASFFALFYSRVRVSGDESKYLPKTSQFQGDLIIGFGYLFLLYHHEGNDIEQQAESSEILDEIGLVWGIILLLCSSVLSAVRDKFSSKIAKEVGGKKLLNAVSLVGAALVLFPLVLLDIIGEAVIGTDYDYSVLSISTLAAVLAVAVVVVVSDFYAESVAEGKLEAGPANIASLLVTFLFALVILSFCSETYPAGHMDHEITWIGIILALIFSIVGMSIPVLESLAEKDLIAASSPASTERTRGFWMKLVRRLSHAIKLRGGAPGAKYWKDEGSGFLSKQKCITGSQRMFRQIMAAPDSRKIFIFLCINFAFMFVEIFMGIWTNSLGLISDAGHMFFDCAALFVGLFAAYISRWKADSVYSYGYGRFEVISGFVNGVFLIFIAIFVITESLERLSEPPELGTEGLLLTSVGGFVVNMIGLVFFHEHAHGGHEGECSHGHSHGNENMKGVFLHVLADLLGSVGVVISSLLIEYKGWYISDPVCSLMISILIFVSVLPLIKSTTEVLLLRTPENMNQAFRYCLSKIHAMEHVVAIREPHLWRHSSDTFVATIHIIVSEEANEQDVLLRARYFMGEIGSIQSVIQVCSQATLQRINTIQSKTNFTFWDPVSGKMTREQPVVDKSSIVLQRHNHHESTGCHGHSHSSGHHEHNHGSHDTHKQQDNQGHSHASGHHEHNHGSHDTHNTNSHGHIHASGHHEHIHGSHDTHNTNSHGHSHSSGQQDLSPGSHNKNQGHHNPSISVTEVSESGRDQGGTDIESTEHEHSPDYKQYNNTPKNKKYENDNILSSPGDDLDHVPSLESNVSDDHSHDQQHHGHSHNDQRHENSTISSSNSDGLNNIQNAESNVSHGYNYDHENNQLQNSPVLGNDSMVVDSDYKTRNDHNYGSNESSLIVEEPLDQAQPVDDGYDITPGNEILTQPAVNEVINHETPIETSDLKEQSFDNDSKQEVEVNELAAESASGVEEVSQD